MQTIAIRSLIVGHLDESISFLSISSGASIVVRNSCVLAMTWNRKHAISSRKNRRKRKFFFQFIRHPEFMFKRKKLFFKEKYRFFLVLFFKKLKFDMENRGQPVARPAGAAGTARPSMAVAQGCFSLTAADCMLIRNTVRQKWIGKVEDLASALDGVCFDTTICFRSEK